MTTELIKISANSHGRQAVSGRELHELLEIETPYHIWFPRMVEYGFVENQDFEVLNKNVQNPQGGRPAMDHAISMDMAKEVSMIQRTEKGKIARQYFIEVERKYQAGELIGLENSKMQTIMANGNAFVIPTGHEFSIAVSKVGSITVRAKPIKETPNRLGRLRKEKPSIPVSQIDEAVRRFLDECCEFGPDCEVISEDLLVALERWNKTNGTNIHCNTLFAVMKQVATEHENGGKLRRFQRKIRSRGGAKRGFYGIALKSTEPQRPLLFSDLK